MGAENWQHTSHCHLRWRVPGTIHCHNQQPPSYAFVASCMALPVLMSCQLTARLSWLWFLPAVMMKSTMRIALHAFFAAATNFLVDFCFADAFFASFLLFSAAACSGSSSSIASCLFSSSRCFFLRNLPPRLAELHRNSRCSGFLVNSHSFSRFLCFFSMIKVLWKWSVACRLPFWLASKDPKYRSKVKLFRPLPVVFLTSSGWDSLPYRPPNKKSFSCVLMHVLMPCEMLRRVSLKKDVPWYPCCCLPQWTYYKMYTELRKKEGGGGGPVLRSVLFERFFFS